MELSEQVSHELSSLPEAIQQDVLDLVKFLKARRLHQDDQAWPGFSLGRALQAYGLVGGRVMSRSSASAPAPVNTSLRGMDDEFVSLEVTVVKSSGLLGTAGIPTVVCRYAAYHLGDYVDDGSIVVAGFQRESASWLHVRQPTTLAQAKAIVAELRALGIPGSSPDVVTSFGTAKTWETILVHVRNQDAATTFEISEQGSGFEGRDAAAVRKLLNSLFALAGYDYDEYCRSLLFGAENMPEAPAGRGTPRCPPAFPPSPTTSGGVSEQRIARVLHLIAEKPGRRVNPVAGDRPGGFHYWFDGGACAQGVWEDTFILVDGTRATVPAARMAALLETPLVKITFPDGTSALVEQQQDPGPETTNLYDRPSDWFCGYCGVKRPDHVFDDSRCRECGLVRPFVGGSMTVIVCECRQLCSAEARYCEWCGRRFHRIGDAGPS